MNMRKVSEDYWIMFLLMSGVFSVSIYKNGTTEFIGKAMLFLAIIIFAIGATGLFKYLKSNGKL